MLAPNASWACRARCAFNFIYWATNETAILFGTIFLYLYLIEHHARLDLLCPALQLHWPGVLLLRWSPVSQAQDTRFRGRNYTSPIQRSLRTDPAPLLGDPDCLCRRQSVISKSRGFGDAGKSYICRTPHDMEPGEYPTNVISSVFIVLLFARIITDYYIE
jgi:hypothetical protein